MKRTTTTLLCAAISAGLSSCISITGELTLPGGEQPGSIGGRIGGTWIWPQPKAPEPPLPVEPGGKSPIPVLP